MPDVSDVSDDLTPLTKHSWTPHRTSRPKAPSRRVSLLLACAAEAASGLHRHAVRLGGATRCAPGRSAGEHVHRRRRCRYQVGSQPRGVSRSAAPAMSGWTRPTIDAKASLEAAIGFVEDVQADPQGADVYGVAGRRLEVPGRRRQGAVTARCPA